MELDVRTLSVILAIAYVTEAFAISFLYVNNKKYLGIGWWVLGSTVTAIGFITLLLRDITPNLLFSIILPNALILAGSLFIYIGILRFLDKRENRGLVFSVFALYLVLYFYFTYVSNDISVRTAIISLFLAIYLFLTAWALVGKIPRAIMGSAHFIAAIVFAQACSFVFRGVMALTIAPVQTLFTPTLIQTAVFLIFFVAGILITFGLVIMVNQRLNAEVSEAKEHFEQIFHTSPDGVLISRSDDGIIVDINEGFTALNGFAREDIIGNSTLDINLWKNPADRQKIVDELQTKGFCENFESVLLRKDGCEITVIMSARRITLKDIPHIISVIRDITERMRVEEALHESTRRITTLIANLQGMVYRCRNDPGWSMEYVSEGCTTLTGYNPDDFVKNRTVAYGDLIHPDDRQKVWDDVQSALKERQPFRLKYRLVTCNGEEKWIWELGRGVFSEDGNLIALEGYNADITTQQTAERARDALLVGLEQKNAELDRFTHTVSHDLKNPLMTIRGFLGLLGQDLQKNNPEMVQKDMDRISSAAEKMERLISTLLELSRSGKRVDTPEPIPFTGLVQEAAGLLDASLKDHGVMLTIGENLPVVSGDRQRLLQVMTNLLENAAKFMGDQKEPRIEVGVRHDETGPQFFVRDNGIGIRNEEQLKIFGLFERLNPEIPGTGIGLATVKRIIEAHGGKIWVESEGVDKGTTFWFTLPDLLSQGDDA